MDLSPEYIKMCEKAKEIQNVQPLLKKSIGSYFRYGNFPDDYYENYCHKTNRYDSNYVECRITADVVELSIWLPRQDQLQEMMDEDAYIWFKNCWDYVQCEPLPLSAEMVGLERVMKEKYNKTWNGEDWI